MMYVEPKSLVSYNLLQGSTHLLAYQSVSHKCNFKSRISYLVKIYCKNVDIYFFVKIDCKYLIGKKNKRHRSFSTAWPLPVSWTRRIKVAKKCGVHICLGRRHLVTSPARSEWFTVTVHGARPPDKWLIINIPKCGLAAISRAHSLRKPPRRGLRAPPPAAAQRDHGNDKNSTSVNPVLSIKRHLHFFLLIMLGQI